MLLAGSAGIGAVEVAAAGSSTLCGAVVPVSGDAVAVGDFCARASILLKLLREHMFPDKEGLVRENVVSGVAKSIVVILGHGVPIEDSMVDSLPNYTDEKSARATWLARQLQLVVEADNHNSQGEE